MEFLPYSNQVLFPTNIPLIRFRQVPPSTTFPSIPKPYPFPFHVGSLAAPREKKKVVFVLGSTGTGKSKLAINLAARFGGEVVNSDKIQVYDGLSVITNKVTADECAGIPHHLIGGVCPDAEFTASDFRAAVVRAVESVLAGGRLPVVAGGSNSYIEELVDGDGGAFRSRYSCVFVWVDVELPVLHRYVSVRVDRMVEMGLVEEARGMFDPECDYSKGIRKAIGLPEMDRYLRNEASADEETKARLLRSALDEIKSNTRKLACRQLQKICRLSTLPGWDVRRVDATEAFLKQGNKCEFEEAWERTVRVPSIEIVYNFLHQEDHHSNKNDGKVVANAAAAADAADTTASENHAVSAAASGGGGGGDAANGGMTLRTTANYCESATTTAASVATAIVRRCHSLSSLTSMWIRFVGPT
ncbi:adenylate isopentenyltransferase 5, chloroplastic-like [Iris pallida]|uniref:adenylate dimethylallyltransferase (ADP/ATP-dependent) n=1 Tax=Iris pallida TaxID=29817 RepID=A0AAX6IBI5_IRIPA|nr:adenylate isopentenyltransferase 5, chloroplastic-like [Iris pallida]